jgi:cell division inhibitor SepF
MADSRLKRAAAWLGLVTDDRYPDYDDTEPTEGVSREDLLAESDEQSRLAGSGVDQHRPDSATQSTVGAAVDGRSQNSGANVTPLESRREPVGAGSPRSVASAGGGAQAATATQYVPQAQAPESTPAAQPERADLSRIVTVHPRSFNDARTIGEHFRDGVPVIMNLTQMENADAKRLVDFAAGLILGLRGNIERVTSKVFLLSPQNVTVAEQDKERIAGGFFNQS